MSCKCCSSTEDESCRHHEGDDAERDASCGCCSGDANADADVDCDDDDDDDDFIPDFRSEVYAAGDDGELEASGYTIERIDGDESAEDEGTEHNSEDSEPMDEEVR